VPVGYSLKKLKVKMAADEGLCGTDYSVRFNGVETTAEVQFVWKFDPPVLLEGGTTLDLRLQAFVNGLLAEVDANTLTAEELKLIVESLEETAVKVTE
jgi:hypothetical protein